MVLVVYSSAVAQAERINLAAIIKSDDATDYDVA